MPSEAAHVHIDALPVRVFMNCHFRFILTGTQTGGSYSVMHIVSPLGSGPGPHVHEEAEEHFHVLEGEVQYTVDGVVMTAGAGDVVHIPRGAVHGFTVTADSATMMATFTPGGEEQALLDGSVPLPGLSES